MESLTDYSYSGMDNGTKVHHFFQGIKSTELEAAVKVVWTKPGKYGTDFDAAASYLGHMVMKEDPSMQSVHIAKIRRQLLKPSVAVFMGNPRQSGIPCQKSSRCRLKNCMNDKASSPLQSRLLYILDHKEYEMFFHMQSLDLYSMQT